MQKIIRTYGLNQIESLAELNNHLQVGWVVVDRYHVEGEIYDYLLWLEAKKHIDKIEITVDAENLAKKLQEMLKKGSQSYKGL